MTEISKGRGARAAGSMTAPERLRKIMRALCLTVATAVSIGACGTVAAAASQGPHAVTRLAAETSNVTPGSTVMLAVTQTLDKGWHTYWRNPGDAGEAPSLTWTLPTGWKAEEIVWPAPERLPVGPIMNYGYQGRMTLPVPVQIPADAKAGSTAHVAVKIDYLICAEVCVPGSATADLDLPVMAGAPTPNPADGKLIAEALSQAPRAGGLTAAWRAEKGHITLAAAGDALKDVGGKDAYFYPLDGTLLDQPKPQVIERGPKGLTFTLVAAPAVPGVAAPTPDHIRGVIVADGKAYEIDAAQGAAPAGASGSGAPVSAAGSADGGVSPGLLLAIGGAFLGGLILNLMPCVFPVLSMKAAALAGHAGEAREARRQALAFLVGVLLTFLGLAGALMAARAAGAAVGWGFQLQSPGVTGVLALIMLAAALNLSGLFEIGTSAQGLGADLAARGGLTGSFFTGVLAVVVAAPCTAPFMGPALGFALEQPAVIGLIVFLFLGLGFAAPFVILSFTPVLIRRMPRPGAWMDLFRKALAFPMYAAAAWLVWVVAQQAGPSGLAQALAAAVALALAGWLYGMGQHRSALGRPALPLSLAAALLAAGAVALTAGAKTSAPSAQGGEAAAAASALAATSWSPEAVASIRAAHKPVFVNFTAAWCVTCQVNEKVAFSSPVVRKALEQTGATYMIGDWTNRDSRIAAALAEHGRIGVPLYLVYPADGGAPKVLPQLLTPELVADALKSAARPTAS